MTEKLKIACIGAGSSGAGQMILMEKLLPGSVVAFCDRDRALFDRIVDGYLGGGTAAEAGDFKTEVNGLRRSFRDIPYDWHGHSHFDGTEFGMKAKLDLLRGRPTEVENSIREGYVSAKMCLAAQKSIETGQPCGGDSRHGIREK